MAGRDDGPSFNNRRPRNQGGGRRSMPPSYEQPPLPEEGFGGRSLRHLKKSEQYNPSQAYDAAVQSAAALKEKKQHKTKFVNLYGERGQERLVVKLPGRNECNCQASMHGLVNNCLKCGRIVCDQEGSGPCFFCSSLVCSRAEQKILDQGGKKAEELRHKLLLLPKPKPTATKMNEQPKQRDSEAGGEDKSTKSKSGKGKSPSSGGSTPSSGRDFDKGLEKALAEKDRLLEYQRDRARRTVVYDDQSDYFTTGNNPWLTDEEREKLRKREAELRAAQSLPRSQRKITLDIAGRQVIEEQPLADLYNPNDAVVQEIYFSGGASSQPVQDYGSLPADDIHRPGFFRPTYSTDSSVQLQSVIPKPTIESKPDSGRLQDGTLQDLIDRGRCLSMHQPFASLLVHGIKKHEGRTWYTTHRGPLWIASTAKQATKEEMQEIEGFYHRFYNGNLPAPLPARYPSSCLLGCVEVVDCLAQEQYQELYPGGESESPYVWICENPRELSTYFPIRGQHKIYKLDPTIHQAAKRMIGAGDTNRQLQIEEL